MLHNFLMVIKEAGINHEIYRNDPEKIASAMIQAVETYQYDGIFIDILIGILIFTSILIYT